MVKKKIAIIIIAALVLLVLLVPVQNIYKDGGTRTYTSLTYKVIVWNVLGGKTGTEIHFFPNNFHELDYYADE